MCVCMYVSTCVCIFHTRLFSKSVGVEHCVRQAVQHCRQFSPISGRLFSTACGGSGFIARFCRPHFPRRSACPCSTRKQRRTPRDRGRACRR